ncbi:hypothetical protein [Runella slithyformis]|uniref:Lipoprotein n=1 Tax=Runella slithyformis (strain ATCC 29530 / DSM 19594 / LMG 11500 / NCIMB 11436 / LSU 4) TaxID=761193 RepID=A0A7U4E8B1_RUNSL|nr:hypothetical protein [Runella slithyformis]AEI51074.1 hypothetical protein Runsl_4758 [Runella slithyformis DSM 19594]
MTKINQKLSVLVATLFIFACNSKLKKEQSYERKSELGTEIFTFKFINDNNFEGSHFAVSKEIDTMSSKIVGSLRSNGEIHFITENENQSIEYLGKLYNEKLVLYSFELKYTETTKKRYTIINPNNKHDSLTYNVKN